VSLSAVSDILWRERDLLELLVFKLDVEHLLLDAGRRRWLAQAGRELEMVREEIRRVEVLRSVEVAALAAELGLGAAVSLRQLAAAAAEPWRSILVDHRTALLNSTREVRALADAGRALLEDGAAATGEALAWLDGPDEVLAGDTGALGPEETPAP
jgi:hypothetical protein